MKKTILLITLLLISGCSGNLSVKEDFFHTEDIINLRYCKPYQNEAICNEKEDFDFQDCEKICVIHRTYGDSVNDIESDFENYFSQTKGYKHHTICRPLEDINGTYLFDNTNAMLRECCYCK